MSTFSGKEVLTTSRGQCEQCHEYIVRVLVKEGNSRQWYSADYANYGYAPHHCPSPQPPCGDLRQAA